MYYLSYPPHSLLPDHDCHQPQSTALFAFRPYPPTTCPPHILHDHRHNQSLQLLSPPIVSLPHASRFNPPPANHHHESHLIVTVPLPITPVPCPGASLSNPSRHYHHHHYPQGTCAWPPQCRCPSRPCGIWYTCSRQSKRKGKAEVAESD